MRNVIKKIFSVMAFLIEGLLITQLVYASQSFNIETSRGMQELIIPDGMTTEEAYCSMAKLYLEERFAHEDLIEQTKSLVDKAKNYELVVDELKSLQDELNIKNNYIIELYRKVSQKRVLIPLVKLGVGSHIETNSFDFSISFGAEVFEKLNCYVTLHYPWICSVELGIKL